MKFIKNMFIVIALSFATVTSVMANSSDKYYNVTCRDKNVVYYKATNARVVMGSGYARVTVNDKEDIVMGSCKIIQVDNPERKPATSSERKPS